MTLDDMALEKIEKISQEIGDIPYKARKIFQKAVNDTSKVALKKEIESVRKRYAFSAGGNINLQEQIKRKSATYANPMSEIISRSAINRLSQFYVTPRRLSHGAGRPKTYRGKVLRQGSVKPQKGFMVRFKSGHEEFVHRIKGKEYAPGAARQYRVSRGLDLTKIAPVYSPATPSMVGKVWETGVREETAELLQKNIQIQIDKYLKARDG